MFGCLLAPGAVFRSPELARILAPILMEEVLDSAVEKK
jgi:hypothetical protein